MFSMLWNDPKLWSWLLRPVAQRDDYDVRVATHGCPLQRGSVSVIVFATAYLLLSVISGTFGRIQDGVVIFLFAVTFITIVILIMALMQLEDIKVTGSTRWIYRQLFIHLGLLFLSVISMVTARI